MSLLISRTARDLANRFYPRVFREGLWPNRDECISLIRIFPLKIEVRRW
jgi:hypothetical protein